MQLKSYVQGRWQAGSARRAVAARCDDGPGDRRGFVRAASISRGVLDTRARSRRAGAAEADVSRARGAAQAHGQDAHRSQGRVLPALLRDRRHESGFLDRHRRRHRHFVRVRQPGTRELPNSRVYVDGGVEALSKSGTFVGQHICVPLEGAAVHINAFNFPVWGMLEKLAPTLLAGVPAIVKPATATAYLTELVVRRIVESGILPEGALQLVCGSVGDLFDHLTCQDIVSFTGSASTAQKLRRIRTLIANSVRFISETDSHQLLPARAGAAPGQPEFDLFVREVVREMTAKAGQKCTAIRKAIVPRRMRMLWCRRSRRRLQRSSSAIRGWSRCAWGRSRRSRSGAKYRRGSRNCARKHSW